MISIINLQSVYTDTKYKKQNTQLIVGAERKATHHMKAAKTAQVTASVETLQV